MTEKAIMAEREIVNSDAIKARVDGDAELLAEITGMFLERSSEIIASIERAIISQDAGSLETSAHCLRGYLVSLHAERASEVALQLEIKGRLNDCVGVRYLFTKLEEEVERLEPILLPYGAKNCNSQ